MMISYSRNREDVILARVFDAQADGFYIDVGARHPEHGSLTKHAYDRGWSGINIEPLPSLHSALTTARPRDLCLQCGLGKTEAKRTLYAAIAPEQQGLSTFDREQAEHHVKELRVAFEEITVPVTTLAKLCKQHVQRPVIDFLSIDARGHEREVLLGADWKRDRPRIVIVAATQPITQAPTHERWEELLRKADYLFAQFDGVSRFYVRAEDRELLPRLSVPVSGFDKHIPHQYHVEQERLRLAHEAREARLKNEVEHLRLELDGMRAHLDGYRNVGPLSLGLANRIVQVKKAFPGVVNRLEKLARSVGRK